MTIIIRTDSPILLDPIICHPSQDSLKICLSYNTDQNLCQMAAGDRFPADVEEMAALRLLTKVAETSTLVSKFIRKNQRHRSLSCALTFAAVLLEAKSAVLFVLVVFAKWVE